MSKYDRWAKGGGRAVSFTRLFSNEEEVRAAAPSPPRRQTAPPPRQVVTPQQARAQPRPAPLSQSPGHMPSPAHRSVLANNPVQHAGLYAPGGRKQTCVIVKPGDVDNYGSLLDVLPDAVEDTTEGYDAMKARGIPEHSEMRGWNPNCRYFVSGQFGATDQREVITDQTAKRDFNEVLGRHGEAVPGVRRTDGSVVSATTGLRGQTTPFNPF